VETIYKLKIEKKQKELLKN